MEVTVLKNMAGFIVFDPLNSKLYYDVIVQKQNAKWPSCVNTKLSITLNQAFRVTILMCLSTFSKANNLMNEFALMHNME